MLKLKTHLILEKRLFGHWVL